ncbi:MAG: hypothetical protein J6N21_11275 [Butyrivibrio sp.]|nr:hypothetical protein [Butyrivibrio sp.]
MRKIEIGFVDFFKGFDPYNNIIYRLLKKNYEVEVIDVTNKDERSRVKYLFFSAFGNDYLNFSCVRIFVTGENLFPNYNLCDYAIGFEHMDFEDRYIRFPIYLWDRYASDYIRMADDRLSIIGDSPENRKFCAIVVSNDNFADPMRENFFRELSNYKRVDSGGQAFNNIGLSGGVKDKNEFLAGYKFSIAFENTSYSGYCTEKLMQAFSAGTVPIYWGDKRAKEVFDENAYIDCTGQSIEQAIKKVQDIDQNDELYNKMLKTYPLIDRNHKAVMEENLYRWLIKIMEQDYEDAKRVPRCGKMAIYEQNYHKKVIMEMKIKKHEKIYKLAKKIWC